MVYVIGNQLSVILVGSVHVDIHALFGGFFRNAPYYVVRFEAGLHEYGNVEVPHYFYEGVQCGFYQFRGFASVGFVIFISLVPECFCRRVESYGEMGRLFFPDQFQYGFRKSENNGSVFAFGIDHRPFQEGIVHLENQRMSVD